MRAIFPNPITTAIWLLPVLACSSQSPISTPQPEGAPTAVRVIPLPRTIVLETAGPSPSDTTVSFTAGTERVIVMRHGPPENTVFAEVSFSAAAFADSGQTVTVEMRPRPGVYGLDLSISVPLRGGAAIAFYYARYFFAPARARQVYRSDAAFEQALAIGRVLPEQQIELLPTTRPQLDQVSAPIPGPGSFLVGAPQ
jgi:hypothetical protein